MVNPVICEVTRGERVESIHRGAFAVVDADGHVVDTAGSVTVPVFARSSLKAMQALPLVESGAADAAGLTARQLAVVMASHSGEPGHVDCVRSVLSAGGLTEGALGCGPHWPRDMDVAIALARRQGRPGRIHNNCSGKHAGFLLASRHRGLTTGDYLAPDHPLQAEVRAIIGDLVDGELTSDVCAVDRCSAPTYAAPLRGLALAFARLATGRGLPPGRAAAARRLLAAAMAEPWHTAGTDRVCTKVMRMAPGSVYVKGGAEGVYVAAMPHAGLGMAMKCDDGAMRAVEPLLAALIARHLGPGAEGERRQLASLTTSALTDLNGAVVGSVRLPADGPVR
jgi:L-asparaginase II